MWAHSAINAPTLVSESLAHFDENSSLLSLHLLIEDQNGLSVPRLEAGAVETLQVHQAYFKAPMLVDIDTSLIDATTAKVTGKVLSIEDQRRLAEETNKQIAA